MNLSELINEILSEWAYRVDNGQPNPKNAKHLAELSIVLSEMKLSHIKEDLVKGLLGEAEEGGFQNPVLNKKVTYKNDKGEDKEGIVGNLLRQPKGTPARDAADKVLPPEGSPERDKLDSELGTEKDGKTKTPPEEGGDGAKGEEEKQKAAAAMFDPKADPAMGARLDREKAASEKLAQKDKKDSEAEKAPTPGSPEDFKNKADKVAKDKEEAKKKGYNDSLHAMSDDQLDKAKYEAEQKMHLAQKSGDDKTFDKARIEYQQHKIEKEMRGAKSAGDRQIANSMSVDFQKRKAAYEEKYGEPYEADIPYPDSDGGERTSAKWGGEEPTGPEGGPGAEPPANEPSKPDTTPPKDAEKTDKSETPPTSKKVSLDKHGFEKKGAESAKHPGKFSSGGDFYSSTADGPPEFEIDADGKLQPLSKERQDNIIKNNLNTTAISLIKKDIKKNKNTEHAKAVGGIDKEMANIDSQYQSASDDEKKKLDVKKAELSKKKDDIINKAAAKVQTDTQSEPANNDPNSKVKKVKGKSSGEEIQTMEMEGGGFVYGTKHGNTAMVDDIIDDVKSKIPKERWKDIVFVGEGGATNDSTGELEFNDEMEYAAPKFKELGADVDTWDGDDMDVHKSDSKLYQKQKEKTGLKDNQILAGNWASMVGQGEGEGLDPNDPEHTMKGKDYLDDEGKQFLQDAAKEAGLPPIEDFDNPTGEKPSEENGWKGTGDRGTLYRLSFPGDNGDKETKINDIQVAFNDARDEHLIEKNKELTSKGKIPITIAGESHVDLVDKMTRKSSETKPEQPSAEKPEETPTDTKPTETPKATKDDIKKEKPGKEAKTDSGGSLYSVGGGYYSDKPNGPAKYVRTESVIEMAFDNSLNEDVFALFEKSITGTLQNGEKITVQELPPRAVKKATQRAKAAAASSTEEPSQQPTSSTEKPVDEPKGWDKYDAPKGADDKSSWDGMKTGWDGYEKPKGVDGKSTWDKTPMPKGETPPPGTKKAGGTPPPPPPPLPTKKTDGTDVPGKFTPIETPPPSNEKGVEKDGKIAGTTIETEPSLQNIDPEFLKQKSTEMNKYYENFKEDKKKAEGIAREKMGYSEEQVKGLKGEEKTAYEDEVKKNQEPTYNLCKVSLPNSNLFCSGNKGIPRAKMPQFKGEPVEGSQAWDVLQKAKETNPNETEANGEPYFRQMLADKGIKVTDAEVPSESLKATQSELVGDKVLGMKSVLDAGPSHPAYKKMTSPLYVSKDGYVVDGHHRWAAITAYNMEHPDNPLPLKAMIIDQDIDQAIETSNDFANEFGVAAKSGKQTGADSSKQTPTSAPNKTIGASAQKAIDKIKAGVKNWSVEEKEFFVKKVHKGNSPERRTFGEAFKHKAKGAWEAIKHGAEHEVHLFKSAGSGVKNFFSGGKVSDEEKKALIGVAKKVAIAAAFGAVGGGLAHGALAFGKHVMMEFIPHVVAETVAVGAGKAALFAGAEDDDADMMKFIEIISKKLESANIPNEIMADAVESYNQNKEDKNTNEMKIESLIKEIISEINLEAKGETFTAIKKDTGMTSVFKSKEARDTAVKSGTHKMTKADKESPKKVAGSDMDYRQTPDIKKSTDKPVKKIKAEPKDSTQSIAKQQEVTKALYKDGKGPLLQTSTTSQQALDNGYVEGASWVAPGNAGSNFNENMSNEGVKILEKYPDLDEETLGRILYERTKNTKLGLQQKDVAIGSDNKIAIPSDIENKEIYRNCIVVARSAQSKNSRATMGADRATQEGKFGKKRTKQVFGGTKEDLARCEQTIAKAPKVFIYDAETDSVYEMPKDVMLNWVKSSGGGENAADTATLTLDEKGNAIYDGWSDKKTLKDIQGNSTLVDDYTKSEERLGNLVSTGQLDEKTANKAKLLLLKDKQSIKDIEAGLKDISIQQSTHFLDLKPKDLDRLGDEAAKSNETKKHFGNFKKSVDDVLSGKAKGGKKTNAIREGILPKNDKETDAEYLSRFNKLLAKKPKLSNGNYFKVMSSVGKAGMLSGDDRKVIERTANAEKAKYKAAKKPLPAGLDTDLGLSELRKKSLGIQTDTFKNLNKLTGKSSTGKSKKLGDLLAFDDAKGLLHLDKIDTPKNEKDYHQILKRNTQLAMEGIAVAPKTIKECLGVGNTKELEDSFELSFVERYTYDKDNVRVTGKVVYVYAINKDGKKEEIAQKVYRPKQGPTAPTANTVTWSAGMQKCFDSKK